MWEIVLRFPSGRIERFTVFQIPKSWKSWTMQQLPYGTDFTGCVWTLEQV
jgi:hypothetical protein